MRAPATSLTEYIVKFSVVFNLLFPYEWDWSTFVFLRTIWVYFSMNSPLTHFCSKLSFSGVFLWFFFFFFFFLASLWSMWDPSSLTRDWTHTPRSGSTEPQSLDHQRNPILFLLFFCCFFLIYTLGILTLRLLNKLQMSFSALFFCMMLFFGHTHVVVFFFLHTQNFICVIQNLFLYCLWILSHG